MNIITIENKFNKLSAIILEKNSEIISLITIVAQLESSYKKLIRESVNGGTSKSELLDLSKSLDRIIRSTIVESHNSH